MIDAKTARYFVLSGFAAAVVSGLIAIFASILSVTMVGSWALVDAVIFFGLAYGIYRGSRNVAIAALAWWLIERIYMYSVSGSLLFAFGPLMLILTCGYVLAVVGAFASPGGGVATRAAADVEPVKTRREAKPKAEKGPPPARELCVACSGIGKTPGTDAACAWCAGAGYI